MRWTWTWVLLWLVAPMVLGAIVRHPEIIAVAVVAFVLRNHVPDPVVWLRTGRRQRQLENAIEVNPENVTARRDLATVQLERRRPARAVATLAPAIAREPASAELHFLLGCAHLQAGDAQQSIASLERAIALDERVRYGDPFLRKGDAHRALGDVDGALAAYEKFVQINGSSLEGLVKLARARSRKGDRGGAKSALEEARRTFRQLPAFRRKGQWTWAIAAYALSIR